MDVPAYLKAYRARVELALQMARISVAATHTGSTGYGVLTGRVHAALARLDSQINTLARKDAEATALLAGLETLGKSAITWAVENALTFGTQMLDFGKKAVEWIAPQLPALGEQLGAFFHRMVTWVVESLPGWIAELQKLGMEAINWVTNALPGLGQNLGEFGGALLGWIIKTAGDVVPELLKLAGTFIAWIATDVVPKLPAAAEAIWTALNTFVGTVADRAVLELAKVGAKFNEWVAVDVLPVLPGKLEAIWESIKSWTEGVIGKVKTKLKEVGTAIIDGIVAGAGALASKLYDSLVSSISGAIDDTKAFFGINSPSDYTYAEIGVWILPGIERAIIDTAPALTDTLVSSLSATMDAGVSVARSGGALIGEAFAEATAGSQSQIAAFQAAMGSISPAMGGMGEFGAGGGHRIQPVMSAGQISHASNVTNYSNAITYNPTYNTPAPPPAMSYAALTTMAGV